MSTVTDGTCRARAARDSRNALAEAEARIEAATGGALSKWKAAKENARLGERCFHCSADLREQTVWRVRVGLGRTWGSVQHAMVVLCEPCGAYRYHRSWGCEPQQCGTCARLVVETEWRSRRGIYCCERCRYIGGLEQAKEKRKAARSGRDCQGCGEAFEPVRADGRYCSNACRQRSYRERRKVAP